MDSLDRTGAVADGLCAFIDAAPSPFHAVAEVAARLDAAGFARVAETDRWPGEPGRGYVVRAGSLVAWSTEATPAPGTPFRIVGAHTDSPNLRIKPRPDTATAGWQQLGVEPYGGLLANSWLDRDLGLSGRVAVRDPAAPYGVAARLLKVDRPLLRVPQLAIHLDREIRETGVRLNPQAHLAPVWGVGTSPGDFEAFVAAELGVERADVLAWDLMAHDLTPSCRLGREADLISAPRLDNLASAYAGTTALVEAAAGPGAGPAAAEIPVLVLFDHEEVGSVSERGASSPLLAAVLERVVRGLGGDREDLLRALAGSACVSADMAHATHPNYPDRHEPAHRIAVNGGPVLKINQNMRYATDAVSHGLLRVACEQAGVPLQQFVTRSDLPCGTTIGPLTAAGVGVRTVDLGAPQLAMHSARELCGAQDPAMYHAAMAAFLAPGT